MKTSIILTALFLVALVVPALAQVPVGPPATPIDGGLSLLLAAGGAYGLKKLSEKKKEK